MKGVGIYRLPSNLFLEQLNSEVGESRIEEGNIVVEVKALGIRQFVRD